jgi:hypothetical protein
MMKEEILKTLESEIPWVDTLKMWLEEQEKD